MLSRPTPARPTIFSLEFRIRPASTFVLPLTIKTSYWPIMLASFCLSSPGWLSTVKPASERILTPSSSIGSEIRTFKALSQLFERSHSPSRWVVLVSSRALEQRLSQGPRRARAGENSRSRSQQTLELSVRDELP